ncbi:hypothetical protein LINPERPRIM_LOCUS9661 [Linum perenne]
MEKYTANEAKLRRTHKVKSTSMTHERVGCNLTGWQPRGDQFNVTLDIHLQYLMP